MHESEPPPRVAWVTGAGGGVGAATARALAARGWCVVVSDVRVDGLDALRGELGERRCAAVEGDVTDLGAMQNAVAVGVERFGGLHAVVANAGVASYGSVKGVDPAAFRRVLDVNVVGAFHTLRAALPELERTRGYALLVSSMAAYVATPGQAAYNASKAGVEHLANVARLEVADDGVAIGSAHMGWIDTALMRDALRDVPTMGEMLETLPGFMRRPVTADACGAAFADAVEARARRVHVPRWVGALALLRPLLGSSAFERRQARASSGIAGRLDADVRRLGRSASDRTRPR
ncbi:MAG: short-chain dehydrogenase/reductase [Solirubrobacteraceae bacterium]